MPETERYEIRVLRNLEPNDPFLFRTAELFASIGNDASITSATLYRHVSSHTHGVIIAPTIDSKRVVGAAIISCNENPDFPSEFRLSHLTVIEEWETAGVKEGLLVHAKVRAKELGARTFIMQANTDPFLIMIAQKLGLTPITDLYGCLL